MRIRMKVVYKKSTQQRKAIKMNYKCVALCFLGIFCSALSVERVFHNTTDQIIIVQVLSWVVNYVGADPYKNTYYEKTIHDHKGITHSNHNNFALLHLFPQRLEPGDKITITTHGSLGQYYCFVDSMETLESEACKFNINSWINKPFHFKDKLFGAIGTYESDGLSKRLTTTLINGNVVYEIYKTAEN